MPDKNLMDIILPYAIFIVTSLAGIFVSYSYLLFKENQTLKKKLGIEE